MISRLGSAISRLFQKTCPDPFVIAILLTALTIVLALLFGDFPGAAPDAGRVTILLDSWRSSDGLWMFLEFGMQMCLILVTGHALASAPLVRAVINRLAEIPRSAGQAVALVALMAAVAGVINWGLGLIVGALMARDVGRAMHRRGVAVHYPLLAAAGYVGLMVWHGGLSGSAPLAMTTEAGAANVLSAQYLAQIPKDGVPLTATIFSTSNLIITGGLVLGAPLLFVLLQPRRREEINTMADLNLHDEPAETPPAPERTIPEILETTPPIAWLLAAALLAGIVRYGQTEGFARVGLNEINALFFALGLILHGSVRTYAAAAEEGARGCAGIILQFPLYGGIMAMMAVSGLVAQVARGMVSLGNETTIPLLTFISAAVVNLFVPSGGGQWGIQGPIALSTGIDAGIPIEKMIMAVAYGDQLTNMLQPFWALPLLAITGVKAREIVGYTAVVMLAAGAWIGVMLVVL